LLERRFKILSLKRIKYFFFFFFFFFLPLLLFSLITVVKIELELRNRSLLPAQVISAVERCLPRVVSGPVWAFGGLLFCLAPCGVAASPCACEILSKVCQSPEGPQACSEAVERLILRDWWKSDMRLTNLLFSALRKALAAQKMPRDAGALVQVCCDVIRGTFGRGTRFFLQVLSDLMLFCGGSAREELVMSIATDLMHTALSHRIGQSVGEHDAPIVAAVIGLVERMLSHAAPVDVEACAALLKRFAAAGVAGLNLVCLVLASSPAFSPSTVPSLLSCLLESSSAQCDALLEDAVLFQQVYLGMASVVSRCSLAVVEAWLWQHMLEPHVVGGHLLVELWSFVLRQSSDLVQIRHVSVLCECFDALESKRQCQRRVSALIGRLFLSCSVASQSQLVSALPNVLAHVPPSPQLCQEVVNAATAQISATAALLSTDTSVAARLAAFCRIGGHQLTHQMAAPLSQSVREVYLRLGASSAGLSMKDQRAAVLLVSSLAMWARADELRKFLARTLQTRSLSPLANVALLGKLSACIDSTCVDAAAAVLATAFAQKEWAVHVTALQAFQLLSTQCASLDAGMMSQLAGPAGSKQNDAIVAFLSSSSRSVKCEFATHLAAVAAFLSVSGPSPTTAKAPTSPNEFANLSITLVNTVRALQNSSSENLLSERFQAELGQCISILQTLKRK
jgi:hypothetical protein